MRTSSIALRGPYSVEEVALMDFGHRAEASFDGVLRLAFCLDRDLEQQVGVEVRQAGDRLDLVVHGEGDLDAVTRQVARVVSADGDGAAYAEVCASDPVLAELHAAAPGFRPSNFHSAYDACVWSVLSARRQRRQAIGLRARLSAEHGRTFELAGQSVHALPTPATLARLDHVPGLQDVAVPRLHAIAEAATAGRLDVDRLVALGPDLAVAELQTLPGIGPFYSSLVVVRACGLTDVLTVPAHTRDAVRRVYGLDHDPDDAELAALAEAWRPFRTWVAVALRAVGTRLGTGPGHGAAA
ncbi:DNA-3-methyladenine glycosylase 2 family protein [Nocardioides anomalus]|uniref:DNA-3-methyladenine glycosylase II n=1 Tax=Nocardioides anomalus TaxID=2712223 RepID=A0A6G6WFD6_9ACTN|nr:DNA-3-methyladenine glycosylase 2 family protein [Nocardioides anomalus]QIG43944.1 DNA-3-methyladenine glycosylase 2 family protein [Nocardioides anomalus]